MQSQTTGSSQQGSGGVGAASSLGRTLSPPLLESLAGLEGKIAIFGGSFDPIHVGHLEVAECVLQERAIDRLIFVPTAQNPLKERAPSESGMLRLQMLCAALADRKKLWVSPAQLRGDVDNYTVDLLTKVRNESPLAELYMVIGADCLSTIERWRDIEHVLRLAAPLVVERLGYAPANEQILGLRLSPQAKARLLQGVLKESGNRVSSGVSSSAIREARARGIDLKDAVLPAVRRLLERSNIG